MNGEPGAGLAVHGLGYAYRAGGEELFGGLDHAFTPGQLTAVTGPSGRGKSTLLYVLGLLLSPRRGEVVLDGRRVDDLDDDTRSRVRARSIGFVFQDAALNPSRTILDSVIEPALYAGHPRAVAAERARSLLDDLGLSVRADHRPGQISGGQAQRVAIARALMNTPTVILADEPTGNLDEGNTELVLAALRSVADTGRTVVLATHDSRVLAHADEIVEL